MCNFWDEIQLNLSYFLHLTAYTETVQSRDGHRLCCTRRKSTKERKVLQAYCDLAYRGEGKEKSIIAAGPLRVAAVIAGI